MPAANSIADVSPIVSKTTANPVTILFPRSGASSSAADFTLLLIDIYFTLFTVSLHILIWSNTTDINRTCGTFSKISTAALPFLPVPYIWPQNASLRSCGSISHKIRRKLAIKINERVVFFGLYRNSFRSKFCIDDFRSTWARL